MGASEDGVSSDGVTYRLDAADVIAAVGPTWDAFAAANDGPSAGAAQVLGRPLWDFVSDATTHDLYRRLLTGVRRGRPVRVQFRCDGPNRRRLMAMEVAGAPGGGVAFRTEVLSVEDRPAPLLLDPHAVRSGELLRMCGWCARIDVGGEWAEVEAAAARLRLFERASLPPLTHGVCERCFAELSAAVTPT